jgi:uncharacterized membrane protein YhfC
MVLSAIISIGGPIFLFILFHKKYEAPFLPMIFGIVAFILFALVLESSLHSVILSQFALREKPFIFMLYGGLMAGIFEETGRFLSFILLKRKYKGISTGLSYGIGHGGIEAIILAGIAMVVNAVLSILVNTGLLETIMGTLQGTALEQINAQITALVTTAPYWFLISGIERIFAIGIQLSLSIIVFYSVFSKSKWWLYPIAIILHAIIDFPAALMQAGTINNVFLVEGLACLNSVLLILLARYIHKEMKEHLVS